MRHVMPPLDVPSREEVRARIVRAERFQPEPLVVALPPVEQQPDGTGLIRIGGSSRQQRIHRMLVEAHAALAEGRSMSEVVDRALPHCPRPSRRMCDALVRGFVWRLHKEGHVHIPLEEPPAVFAGRYERVEELGRGGMGVVYLCEDLERARDRVVIKHAWGWSKPIEKAERTLRREAAALRRLDHPSIPGIRDTFEVDGLLHLVRDFAPGRSITRLDPRPHQLPTATRRRLVKQVAEALAHVHERGLLYLDMKPGNLVIRSVEDGPKLLDFGVCREIPEGGVLKLKASMGSRGYAPPEIVRERVASVRADVYSLGRTHFALATGVTPKARWHAAALAEQLSATDVPQDERDIILRMCADAPGERFATMDDVLAALG